MAIVAAASCKPAAEEKSIVVSRVPSDVPGEEAHLNVHAQNVKLGDLIPYLETAIGVEIDGLPPAEANGNITITLEDVEWRPALRVVLDVLDLAFVETPGRVHIMTKSEFEALPPVTNSYRITHSNYAEAVRYALRRVPKLESVSCRELAGSGSILVVSHPSKEADVAEFIDSVNRRTSPFEYPRPAWPRHYPPEVDALHEGTFSSAEFQSDTIFLEHVSATHVQDRLRPYLDAAGGETAVVFDQANAVVIRASQANLDRLRRISAYLDDPRWLTNMAAAADEP